MDLKQRITELEQRVTELERKNKPLSLERMLEIAEQVEGNIIREVHLLESIRNYRQANDDNR